MDYAQEQRNPARHLSGIAFVIVIHVVVVYALVTGLAHKVVAVVRGPLETRLIEEFRKPPPETPPPPKLLPKLAPPPPAFIPPPEINIAVAAPVANTISQVTSQRPAAPPPVVRQAVRSAPVIDARQACAKPEYPPVSRRLEEAGIVTLSFLIDLDGRVIDSRVTASSGYERLDQAARAALSLCRFKPGTVDGKPEQSWASIKYNWDLQ